MKKIIILCLSLIATLAYSQDHTILNLSDIHFNPYDGCKVESGKCKLLGELIEEPISKWNKLLGDETINHINQETNNAFLVTGLDKLKPLAQNKVQTIFITGDLLTHKFRDNYDKYAPSKYTLSSKSENYYSYFCYKTLTYILSRVHYELPHANIYLALGNNDSDTHNYQLASKGMLVPLSKYLLNFIPNKYNNHQTLLKTYSKGGYYSSNLGNNVTLIALNTNMLSRKSKNTAEAYQQLNWLKNTLKNAKATKQKVIILQHIPYGMDLFKTVTIGVPVNLLNSKLQDAYLQTIDEYSSIILNIYAGHLHSEYWSLIAAKIPLIGTIAFNAGFGNNPGFKISQLDSNWHLLGYHTYYTNLESFDKEINWQLLYTVYLSDTIFSHLLSNFPSDIKDQMVKSYRKHYRATSNKDTSSINDDTKWKYYYCAINQLDEPSYTNCLNKFGTS